MEHALGGEQCGGSDSDSAAEGESEHPPHPPHPRQRLHAMAALLDRSVAALAAVLHAGEWGAAAAEGDGGVHSRRDGAVPAAFAARRVDTAPADRLLLAATRPSPAKQRALAVLLSLLQHLRTVCADVADACTSVTDYVWLRHMRVYRTLSVTATAARQSTSLHVGDWGTPYRNEFVGDSFRAILTVRPSRAAASVACHRSHLAMSVTQPLSQRCTVTLATAMRFQLLPCLTGARGCGKAETWRWLATAAGACSLAVEAAEAAWPTVTTLHAAATAASAPTLTAALPPAHVPLLSVSSAAAVEEGAATEAAAAEAALSTTLQSLLLGAVAAGMWLWCVRASVRPRNRVRRLADSRALTPQLHGHRETEHPRAVHPGAAAA